jgi:hypothetical protein
MFSPNITVGTSRSIFSLEIDASVSGLPSNEMMEYWIFEPDGDSIHSGVIESDKNGNFKNQWGINVTISLHILPAHYKRDVLSWHY